MTSYRFLTCKHCKWESKSMTQQELTDLGVPWYCDNCGKRVEKITTYTDKDLELEIAKQSLEKKRSRYKAVEESNKLANKQCETLRRVLKRKSDNELDG